MKNTIKTFAVTAITALLLSQGTTAQSVASGPFENAATVKLAYSVGNAVNEKNSNTASSINPRAIENFQRSFMNVTGASWSKTNDGYFARFTKDSVQTRVDYNRKGRWMETIRYYGESKLPGDVSYMIKRGYGDYSIFGVAEVSFDAEPVYLVYIKNGSRTKMIGVYEGEMTIVQDFKNSDI